MLPLFLLPECQTCGTSNQGTRAKAGNSVKCSGCGTMRRVPADRPTVGRDDPRAARPARGRPLEPGNAHRFIAGGVRPEVAAQQRYAGRTVAAPAPAASLFVQSSPIAAPAREDDEFPPFVPYKPCERCKIEKYTDPETGEYPPAVVRIQLWEGNESRGDEYQCADDYENWREWYANKPGWQIGIIELPRTKQDRPTYRNPESCPHLRLEYDPEWEVTRCLDCSAVKPGYGMPNGWRAP